MVPGSEIGVESASEGSPGTYNQSVKSVLLNRIAMVLSIVGMYVAGVLSYSSALNVQVPCSVNSTTNCALVTSSEAGKLLGIPVAYLGFLTYVLILGFAIMRARSSGKQWDLFSKLGFWLTGFGLAFSLYLQTVSISQLGQKCEWCIASAVTMLGLFVVHGLISQTGRPEGDEIVESGMQKLPKTETMIVAGAAILALAAFGMTASGMTKEAEGPKGTVTNVSVEALTANKSKFQGNPDAKVVVIEVADILCPACRTSFPEVKEIFEQHRDKMYYGFISMPLFNIPGHETSIEAAMVAEYAAEKEQFWAYMDMAFDPANEERVKSVEGLIGIASQLGFNTKELKERMDDTLDPSLKDKVTKDFYTAVTELKIGGTPSFLVSVNGGDFQTYSFEGFKAAMESPEVKQYLK